jgi:hypothetical protein
MDFFQLYLKEIQYFKKINILIFISNYMIYFIIILYYHVIF